MTIGELARRTGLSVNAIREYEARGLYTVGRSTRSSRLFEDSPSRRIERLAGVYLSRPDEPIGPHIATLLTRAEGEIDERMAALEDMRRRIEQYRAQNTAALAGRPGAGFAARDPRRRADAA